jgi:hypothetical protein
MMLIPSLRCKEPDPDVVTQACCLPEGEPELFFLIGNADPAFHEINTAKVICRTSLLTDSRDLIRQWQNAIAALSCIVHLCGKHRL